MSRIRAGFALTRKSWGLLQEHRGLLRFPVYGGLAAVVALVLIGAPGLFLIDDGSTVPGIALAAVGVYVSIFLGYYFSVGLAVAADRSFRGEPASVADGLAVSRERMGAIAGWALVSVVAGAFFAALENIRVVGPIISALLNTAWSLITFLAVPVIAIEGTGPIETVKRSGTLFRERWAGQVTGNLAIGGIFFLCGVLPAAAMIGIGVWIWSGDGSNAGAAVLIGLGVIVGVVAMILMRALSGIFGIALYRYAATGEATGGFTQQDLESAVKVKPATA